VTKQDRKETVSDSGSTVIDLPPPAQLDTQVTIPTSSDSESGELQYIVTKAFHKTIVGVGTFDEDLYLQTTGTRSLTLIGLPIPPTVIPISETANVNTDYSDIYAYSTIKPNARIALTLGLSYDDLTDRTVNRTTSTTNEINKQIYNPKLGINWQVNQSTTLRLAGFRTLNRPFVGRQTLEPTQIAGFNQFFDDLNGTESERYGIGLDHSFGKTLFAGIEFSTRKLDVPILIGNREVTQDEDLHRVYVNWTPNRKVAFSAQGIFDGFSTTTAESGPEEMDTFFFPLRVGVFPFGGFFANVTATWVRQDVEYFQFEDKSRFWTVDADVNYRLPKRLGIISLGVTNLFDEVFNYQDRNFQTAEPRRTAFVPERRVFVRLMLSLD
jgi:hypothetical protein